MYNIVLGRNESDLKLFGEDGTIFLGKHYVTMERTKSLANPVLLDINRPHVILISGKRGSGKSYTLGVIAEGLANLPGTINKNVGCIIFDTMGIFWTMKHANFKDDELLHEWELKPKGLKPKLFVPKNLVEKYEESGIPVDVSFSVKPSSLDAGQWCSIFDIELNSNTGILIERAILGIQTKDYDIPRIIDKLSVDKDSTEDERRLAVARFKTVSEWGLFDKAGTKLDSLVKGGQVSIIDLSAYSQFDQGSTIKSLIIGLISKRLLQERLLQRKTEEVEEINELGSHVLRKQPLIWLLIDEAHEFLPKEGKTLATQPLIQLLREGRQPGISVVLATQQPGKIHTDVMTQSDLVLSHRLTARIDVDALNQIMQSYLPGAIQKFIDNLPSVKGAAIALDDNSEKIYPMRVRPRFSWHGGEDPSVIRKSLRDKLKSS